MTQETAPPTTAAMAGVTQDFLSQLRQVNTERYHAWVGDGQDAGIMFDAMELGGEVGELLNVVKKLEREDRGWRGSRADPADFSDECADVLICLDKLARRRGVDLMAATIAKFNATSEKNGFPHRLAAQQPAAGVVEAIKALGRNEADIHPETAAYNSGWNDALFAVLDLAALSASVAPAQPHPSAALSAEIVSDPETAWAWHCNIAVPIMDAAGVSHQVANETAAHLMQHLFGCDITTHPAYEYGKSGAQEYAEMRIEADRQEHEGAPTQPMGDVREAGATFVLSVARDGRTTLQTHAAIGIPPAQMLDKAVEALLAERADVVRCPMHVGDGGEQQLPCPHCGGQTFTDRNLFGQPWTTCANRNCGSSAPEAMWNQRATPQPRTTENSHG